MIYPSLLLSRYGADRSIVGHLYVSNAAITLATVSATIRAFFWRYALVRRTGTAYRQLFSRCRYTCRDVQII